MGKGRSSHHSSSSKHSTSNKDSTSNKHSTSNKNHTSNRHSTPTSHNQSVVKDHPPSSVNPLLLGAAGGMLVGHILANKHPHITNRHIHNTTPNIISNIFENKCLDDYTRYEQCLSVNPNSEMCNELKAQFEKCMSYDKCQVEYTQYNDCLITGKDVKDCEKNMNTLSNCLKQ